MLCVRSSKRHEDVQERAVQEGGSEVNRRKAAWGIGVLLLVAIVMMAMVGCGGTTTTTAASTVTTAPAETTTTAPAETTTTAPAETTTTALQPVAGGTLTYIVASGPQDVGWWPKMGPTDEGSIFPAVERLMDYKDKKLQPFLAKTFVEDPTALTMTCELNPGIMFSDGTELTADNAKWMYQIGIDGKKIQYADAIKSVEVTGKYTFVIHLNYWHNQLIQMFGWMPMISEAAYTKAGADDKARQAWATDNLVGTGPFILKSFVRDQSLTWVKNPNYWAKGDQNLPYLDEVDFKVIPDMTTATQMMQAGQADILAGDSQARDTMKKAGFIDQSGWAGFLYHLMPNTVDPKSPCAKPEVRKALEYAINKEEMTASLGYGLDVPIYAVEPPSEWGGNAVTDPYKYDPAKAKSLLASVGYSDTNPCKIDLMAIASTGGGNSYAEAIKGYLDKAGFQTNLSIVDAGAFYGGVFGTGWKDVALMFSGMDPNGLISINRWWSQTPMTNLASLGRPEDFKTLVNTANKATDEAGQIAGAEAIVKYMHDNEMMIPLYESLTGITITDKVHTMYPAEGFIRWDWANTWKAK